MQRAAVEGISADEVAQRRTRERCGPRCSPAAQTSTSSACLTAPCREPTIHAARPASAQARLLHRTPSAPCAMRAARPLHDSRTPSSTVATCGATSFVLCAGIFAGNFEGKLLQNIVHSWLASRGSRAACTAATVAKYSTIIGGRPSTAAWRRHGVPIACSAHTAESRASCARERAVRAQLALCARTDKPKLLVIRSSCALRVVWQSLKRSVCSQTYAHDVRRRRHVHTLRAGLASTIHTWAPPGLRRR